MESDAAGGPSRSPDEKQALNSTILEYYKKFGRKRDLEQYFSLNTAQGEIADVSSLFWRRMKSQDSSDSGEKSRDTSLEVCRIRIHCSAPDIDAGSSKEENPRTKSDSESPPIINEEIPKALDTSQHSDDGSVKSDDKSVRSDDNHSQKSVDANLDTSTNKAYSPSSSITSQRRLEWDSLADVGYANESDKKTSASTLSTLERLALQQQYSNNDTHQDNLMGVPTAHSTPVDENEINSRRKGSKTTKIYRKDVDCVEVNVPQGTDANSSQSINVNLTKHISFSVDKGGEVSVDNVKKDYSISPEKKSVEAKEPQETVDKEIQTSLIKSKEKSSSSGEIPRPIQLYGQGVPVLINLNNLKRARRKKVNLARKKSRVRKKIECEKENVPVLEKSGEQVSEAESFEYMPGHIYNQNQMNNEPERSNQTAGNKSSLESSGALTTDSSKGSKNSFTKDLEKSIKLLRTALNKRYDDAELKKTLIKDVVQRLLNSNYRDDESTTEFLSGLSLSSRKLGLGGTNTTTSTSDANNTAEKLKITRPKKSILRVDKFNPSAIASTSQSAPNLPTASNSEIPVTTNLAKALIISNSSSDTSSKGKTSSDTAFAKTSSEELYQKYLDALRREEAYKRHLREKEQFLKQKLVASDAGVRSSATLTGSASRLDLKSRIKLKELMTDLTRNNYDDGSGDASKLEGGLVSNMPLLQNEDRRQRSQRSHSVFTLSSSGNSDQNKKSNMKKSDIKEMPKAGHSKDEKHYCCCPHHFGTQIGVTDSSVQVNIRSDQGSSSRMHDNVAYGPSCPAKAKESQPPSSINVRSNQATSPRKNDTAVLVSPRRPKASQPITHIVSDENTGDIKYLCLCNTQGAEVQSPSENFMIYKCSRLSSKGVSCNVPQMPKSNLKSRNYNSDDIKLSKGSQTLIKKPEPARETICVHEAIRVIQTDISINPRISDPSLSDIKITNQCDCVKLVREQFRQVSKTSVDSGGTSAQAGDNDIYSQPSTSTFRTGKDNTKRLKTEVEIQSDIDSFGHQAEPRAFYGDNGEYTIPIQGTNTMTLKVSVGTNPITNLEILDSRGLGRPIDTVESDETIYSRKNDVVRTMENATSLTEECSKGVQSDNRGLFSQYERKPRTVNTLFSKQDTFNRQNNNAPLTQPQRKPLLRSNTFAGIKESNNDVRNEIIEDFYDQEQWSTYPKTTNPRTLCACRNPTQCSCRDNVTYPKTSGCKILCACPRPTQSREEALNQFVEPEVEEEIDSVESQIEMEKPPPPQKTDTGTGPQDGMNLDQNNCFIDHTLRSKKMCPCPQPSKCCNECPEDAVCWKTKHCPDTALDERKPEVKTRQKTPCSCPDSAKCGGYCWKDSACRIKHVPDNSSCSPRLPSRPSTPRKSPPSRPASSHKSSSPPRKCPCADSAKCGGQCGNNARCRQQAWTEPEDVCALPQSPPKSPRKASNDDKALTIGPPLGASLRSCSPLAKVSKPASPRKYPCNCPNSAKCGGLCKKDAPCRPKTPEAKESGPDGDTAASCISPPENSDSDQPDFEKLKTFLRSQTFPQQTKKTKTFRSPSLPVDKKIYENKAVVSTEGDESPSEEHILAPGTSKIKTSESNDLIMNVIRDITNRYSKKGLEQNQKKKCFKEILSILNYLLDTEDVIDSDAIRGLKNLVAESTSSESNDCRVPALGTSTSRGASVEGNDCEPFRPETVAPKTDCQLPPSSPPLDCMPPPPPPIEKKTCDKGIQLPNKKSKVTKCCTESSDLPSSERHGTSSDSVTCKVLNKIRRECEKYHRKCCKRQTSPKRCQCSSTTSMSCDQCKHIVICNCRTVSANCDQCKRVHYCQCRPQPRCKSYRPKSVCERVKKKCVAYNLIIQTSESMVSEEVTKNGRPLKNIIVKVPSRKQSTAKVPFKEMEYKIGQHSSPRSEGRSHRSKSLPNDSLSSSEDVIKGTVYSVKDYLERNRPDFIEQSGQRQKCLKMISEASDQCTPCNSCNPCNPCRPCSPAPKTIIIHGGSNPTTPRCQPPCTLFCRGVQMGCDPFKSDPCRPNDSCESCEPCKPCDAHGPCSNPCSPFNQCTSFDSCNPCADKMHVTTIEKVVKCISCPGRFKSVICKYLEASNRAAQRKLLSMQVQVEPALRALSESDLRHLANQLGFNLRQRKEPPKLISEREMKKHSERIYKKLPEVVQKKEDLKKENIKKTNLLMASIFKKNLQKKALRGYVNLSNYSNVIKI